MSLFAGLCKRFLLDFSALCGRSQGTFEPLQAVAADIDDRYIRLYLMSGMVVIHLKARACDAVGPPAVPTASHTRGIICSGSPPRPRRSIEDEKRQLQNALGLH